VHDKIGEKYMINIKACFSPRLIVICTRVRLILPGGTYPIKFANRPIKKVRNIIIQINGFYTNSVCTICLLSAEAICVAFTIITFAARI